MKHDNTQVYENIIGIPKFLQFIKKKDAGVEYMFRYTLQTEMYFKCVSNA